MGTVGVSAAIDRAVADGRLDLAPITDTEGPLRWEGFVIALVDGVLHLAGADRRGTVYAVYRLAEAMGVSPWRWWADVPVRTRDHLTVATDAVAADWPTVRYRGVFLNDEEELDDWARTHTDDDTIGPETYARVAELILRLGGNYLWPAMHVNAFNHDPDNGRVVDELGVVVGTSHCDMLLRSNEHEFRPWAAAQDEPVEYDYSLPGRNRELLQEYWRGSVAQNRDYEVTWTVGMRGIHDYGFSTRAIDADDSLSHVAKQQAKVDLLARVIRDQRELLREGLGCEPSEVPQLFVPYKEVLGLYDAGLPVPDDVTIMWANDNFGHIRRLPSDAERERAGGHGLYYHASYWSSLTTSYLATSSTPLALMKSELRRAWEGGIQRLWVLNIGGIKPLEHEMTFFLRTAWDAGREQAPEADEFTAAWLDAQFSGGIGEWVTALHAEYSAINQQRKIEHLTTGVFDAVVDGDEAGRRLERLRRISDELEEVRRGLPEAERDAFLQLVAVKVHTAWLVNGQYAHADRSRLAHEQGKAAAADHHLAISRAYEAAKRALFHHYNHVMSDGKWSRVFTPDEFPPPVLPQHAAAQPALTIGDPGLLVVAWGEEAPSTTPRLHFDPFGLPEKWIEVATSGQPLDFAVTADDWLHVAATSGTVATEQRIAVRIWDWERAADGAIVVTSPTTGERVSVAVSVGRPPELVDGFDGVVEADGHVTIDPASPTELTDGAGSRWVPVPGLGRYGNAALQVRPAAADVGAGPAGAEYRFHLTTPGAHLLEVHRLPTLDSTGRIRVGIGVDDRPTQVLESPTTDEHRGVWNQAIQDNGEKLRLHLPYLEAGPHTLRLEAMDDNVTLSKLVLFTTARRGSNLGPQLSSRLGWSPLAQPDPDPLAVTPDSLADWVADAFGMSIDELSPPEQQYQGPAYWTDNARYVPSLVAPQPPGQPRFVPASDGSKDVLAQLGTGIVLESHGVVAFEAENCLAEEACSWTTPDLDGHRWTHTQAETDGRTGLAMHVLPRGLVWRTPGEAPALHQRIRVDGGRYRVWLLLKADDHHDDTVLVAVDGHVQHPDEQFCGGQIATYGTRELWMWVALSEVEIEGGDHTFSIVAAKSGLRVDRVYLATGDEFPPVDADWERSPRDATS